MKKRNFLRRTAWAVAFLGIGGSTQAGVIQGTGVSGFFSSLPQASASKMAKTNAVKMTLSENGPGHILVIPYFSTQAGQATVVRLVNTDLYNGKAVKLHIRGAANGDALLNFQLLLAPGDSWVGTLTQGSNGTSLLTSNDKTCTYPALPAAGVPLLTYRLNPKWTAAEKNNHTREGLIEAIVAADIPSSAMYGPGQNAPSALFTAIQPVNGSAPCTASALDAALLTDLTVEANAARLGFSTPSGSILANWSIADPVKGATYSGTATAFAALDATGSRGRANFVLFPQTADAMSDMEKFTSDPLLIPGVNNAPPPLPAAAYDLPDLSTPYIMEASESNSRRTKSRLSELLAAWQVNNQFMVDAASSGKTDWVFTMPTKRYYVGQDYSKTGAAAVVRPRTVPDFMDYDYFMTYHSTDPRCIDRPFGAYMDRNARQGLSMPTPPQDWLKFCGAASVVSFNGPNNASALSASLTVQKPSLPASITSGWANISTHHFMSGLGLPMLGASFVRQPNSGPPSASAGLVWSHSLDRLNR